MKWLNSLFNKKESINEILIVKKEIENEWDEVHAAYVSLDLKKMLKVTDLKTSLMNRHYLLQSIVSESYKFRKEEYYKNICLEYSKKHLEEFPEIFTKLKQDNHGNLPRVSTFQNYSTLLAELGEYEKAISICELAISYELNDGTKSNYQGRIDRFRKKI
jgi:hypothetical protein